MKRTNCISLRLAAGLIAGTCLHAGEPTPEIIGLHKAATDFVEAYNKKDATAIAALFTEEGEITDLYADDITSGREAIQAHYAEVFSEDPASMAVEVTSVRIVSPGLAIEDGTVHLTPAGEGAPPRSMDYTAVLRKEDNGSWKIASTRGLRDSTEAAGRLADLASVLNGEWTSRNLDGLTMDLAFGWDSSGKFILGETLTTTKDGEQQPGSIRIGWDGARNRIVSWIFDARGGANHSIWTTGETGWLVRTEGTTADGETLTANQTLTKVDANSLTWSVTNRVVDGESLPDNTLRLVRQAPEPSSK